MKTNTEYRFRLLLMAVSLLSLGLLLQAGHRTWRFEGEPTDLAMGGTNPVAMWRSSGGNPGGFLALCYPLHDRVATVVFPDIDSGDSVHAFTFSCDVRSGNGSGDRPGHGWAVSMPRNNDPFLATGSTADLAAGFPEAGTTTGIAICFDTWSGDGLPDCSDVEGIIIRVDNVTVCKKRLAIRDGENEDAMSLQTGPRDLDFWAADPAPTSVERQSPEAWDTLCWQPLCVRLDGLARITVVWKGVVVVDQFQADFFPLPFWQSRVVLTGGTREGDSHVHFDNITLTTDTFCAESVPPDAPAFLNIARVGPDYVKLEWGEVTGFCIPQVSFEVMRDDLTLAKWIVGTTYTDNSVAPGHSYTYRVRAVDRAGMSSPWTSVASGSTLDFPAIDHHAITGNTLKLHWNRAAGGMKLQRTLSLTDPHWRDIDGSEVTTSIEVPHGDGQEHFRLSFVPPSKLVWIPPGTFMMGSPEQEQDRQEDEGPQTEVTLTKGFWMSKYEVTQAEYLTVTGENPSWFNGMRGEVDYGTDLTRPVENVSLSAAVLFCETLTEQERSAGRLPSVLAYRLPTEAEWEYACRAGTTTRFSYGDDPGYTGLSDYAWHRGNSEEQTHPVGQKLPNPWGLYDMHGNVWEWCQGRCGVYPGGSLVDPCGFCGSQCEPDVARGGCWSTAIGSRSSARLPVCPPPTYKPNDTGIRVVLD